MGCLFTIVIGPSWSTSSPFLLYSWVSGGAEEVIMWFCRLIGGRSLDSLPDGKYKIRALRGHIRLVRQFSMPQRQRVQMCVDSLNASQRPDEQKLILEVMER